MISKKKFGKKRLILISAILLTCLIIGAGVHYFYKYRYHMAVAYHMPSLAGAIGFYYDEYGALPAKLETIEAEGLASEVAYRLPKNVWEIGNKHTGQAPYYLPVQNWDGKTPYIIAVQGEPGKGQKGRNYVILLDTKVCFVSNDKELSELLKKDDQLREKTGQIGRWANVPWKK